MSIKSKLGAGVFSLCAMYASSIFAAAALTGPPIIDTSTQGQWSTVGEYGTCYNVLPQASPRHLIPEIEIGPDFEGTNPEQYQNPPAGDFPDVLCIGGDATGNFDVRIFSTAPSTGPGSLPNHAYAWGFDEHDCVPSMADPCAFKVLPGRAQENACQGTPYPSTFDSDQYAFDPLSAELKLIKGGDGQIAYYFLSEDRVCRSQDYVLKVNGVIVPGAVGTVDDISNGTYVVFDLIDIPDGAVIRLDVTQADPNCAAATDEAFNSHMSGIFVNGTEACAPPPDGDGCTPGFWKNTKKHLPAWVAPYTPGTAFGDVFDNAFPGLTLKKVLKAKGGGLNALGRHTVAALLNAANSDIGYGMTPSDVIDAFNAVWPGTKAEYTALKNEFAADNERGCPINGKTAPSS